ncbi:GntR family transcriptional regulator [Nonomuraea mesophila]|uniref:GntR family transcriptional regulator n=1 Tax=Nonomuraea mesophila TaxID=2530382 RepID=A0A4R5EZE8_9ACTN|nr:winged helix-turn-helix domain-containing protein [Nonomuraea mesophila]TDE40479.1 GntR family transcriptional regulator [Nonomuraea mesophila]
MVFKWRANAPKWQQIADELKARIVAGKYPPDTALPSQHEIVEEFGVATGTAQKVLRRMNEQGWSYGVKGVGTFVAPDHPEQDQ